MYSFLKNFLKKKEVTGLSLDFDAIPGLLDEREHAARTLLKSQTDRPMQHIRHATEQLKEIVKEIHDAEHDPEVHPKLKTIAKNSLPLFVKAITVSLSKQYPEDIEKFYDTAIENLKGCLNSTRGQGRYLQAVFPEEMKKVKSGIDGVGREINTMTSLLAAYRKETVLIEAARKLYDAIADIQEDLVKSAEKEERIATRTGEMTARISAIAKEREDLSHDDAHRSLDDQRFKLAEMRRERDEVMRTYAALSMTSSHVIRKAEKIASRQRHTIEINTLRQSMALLSDHSIPECTDLIHALAAACPIAKRMIEAGEISLKNKEERAIFSDIDQFCMHMNATCNELMRREELCKKAQHTLSSHPLIARMNALERERTQLEIMLEKEMEVRQDLLQWRGKTVEKVPALTAELRKKIEEIVGETVQLQMNDRREMRG